MTEPLEEALVRSLAEAELRRALVAVTVCFMGEVDSLHTRLKPILQEFAFRNARKRARAIF